MEIVALGWLGTRTRNAQELADFYQRVLGLPLVLHEPGFWVFKLPTGYNVEVFDTANPGKDHFDTGRRVRRPGPARRGGRAASGGCGTAR